MLKFGKVFRTKGGKFGRYLYRHRKKVAFVAVPLLFKNTPDLEFTEGAKNVGVTAAGLMLMEAVMRSEGDSFFKK